MTKTSIAAGINKGHVTAKLPTSVKASRRKGVSAPPPPSLPLLSI